ncbi:MAG: tetratricopeptide repeat-containing sulfotransferase family protein [Pseudomonadota bacterium]
MTKPPAGTAISEILRRGFAALQEGRHHDAARSCREAIALDPACAEAHFLVGLVALDMDDLKTAARAFGSVTKIDADHAAAWAQLARIFMRMGQPARAEKALAEAVRAGVREAEVADLIGVVSSLLGDQKAAKRWYLKAHAAAPDRADYAVNLATAEMFLGETEAARATLEKILRRNGGVAQAEWLYSSIVKAEATERAQRLTARGASADAQSAAFLHYAAGKEFEDCGEWRRAFAAFEAGARAKRSLIDYDETEEEAFYSALIETFTPEWAASAREGCDDPAPIFVVGQPRTGTTLIERIITSHSMVESAGELQQFGLSLRRLSNTAGRDWRRAASAAKWAEVDPKALGAEYLRVSSVMRTGAPRFVDKLPGNHLYLPMIIAALPNARIVHLTRHPMDACFASYKQLFADAYLHSYDQGEMARHFARYSRLMNCWRRLYPGRFLDVSYEAVVSGVEPEARRLIAFLGLPWEDACLRFHEQEASVATASAIQVREKAHTRSVGRWKRYKRELEPMARALGEAGVAL